MSQNLLENFDIATQLEADASDKIQAVLRCVADNFPATVIKLKNPAVNGRTVEFEVVSGDVLDLDDCCGLRNVTMNGNQLEA